MATLLTTSWKNIGSKTIANTGYSDIVLRIYAKYSSQSTTNNTTSVQRKLVLYLKTGNFYSAGCSWSLTGCGSKSGQTLNVSAGEKELLSSASANVSHNTDGSSKTHTLTCKYDIYGASGSFTAKFTVPKINRIATVSSATNFTDEENPTVKFSNPGGMSAKPYLNFYDSAGALVYGIERSTSVSSPYTWKLTDEERENIRKATNKQSSYRVQVGVHTYNGTTNIGYSYVAKTMTYVNANPTYTSELVEINQKVIDLLGNNSNSIVKNASNIKATIVPYSTKHASVISVKVTHGKTTANLTDAPYEYIFTAESEIFEILVTDSRGLTASGIITKELIDYLPVLINSYSFKRVVPTSSNLYLNANIQYKQVSFNNIANVPTIKWKRGAEGELHTLTNDNYSFDEENNLITIDKLILENVIDYTEEDTLYLYISDLLSDNTQNMIVIVGIPVYEYGEHDFQVNGDLIVADTTRQNPINIKQILESKINYIVACKSNNQTINVANSRLRYYINEIISSNGNKLIFHGGDGTDKANSIEIGEGINHVEVSGQVYVSTHDSNTNKSLWILKNGNEVSYVTYYIDHNYNMLKIGPIIIPVTEGDIITLGVRSNTGTGTVLVGSTTGANYLSVKGFD